MSSIRVDMGEERNKQSSWIQRSDIFFESIKPLWDEVGSYNYWDKHRNEFLTVEEDTRHLRNLLLSSCMESNDSIGTISSTSSSSWKEERQKSNTTFTSWFQKHQAASRTS